jgi:hypothetical protein
MLLVFRSMAAHSFHTVIRSVSLAVVLAGAIQTAQAGTVDWGGATDDVLLTAGANVMPSSYIWEMGSFASGFVPDSSNLGLWEANWKPVEQAAWGAGTSASGWWTEQSDFVWDPGTSTYSWMAVGSPETPATNANTWVPGDRMYLWVYNTKTIAADSEWSLVTGANPNSTSTDWVLPTKFDQGSTDYQWRLSQADTVIFGGLNNVDGPGANTPPGGAFDLQTAVVVPEPSSIALALAAALAVGRRRRAAV